MLNKNNLLLAGLTGASAAAVTVLSIGGYFLHRKVLKHRLQDMAKRQEMNLAFLDLVNGSISLDGLEDLEDFDFGDCDEDAGEYDDEDDYLASLFEDFGEYDFANKENNDR